MAQTASSLRLRRPPSLRRGTSPLPFKKRSQEGSRQRRFWPPAPLAHLQVGPGTPGGSSRSRDNVFTARRVEPSAADNTITKNAIFDYVSTG